MHDAITEHLDLWTSALLAKSTAGRGSNGKVEAYGIKKLRELILELAVRGKLVPQDPNDEPASVLLKQIAIEKACLGEAGTLKKQKPLPQVAKEEQPFEVPTGWEFIRLGTITNKIGSGSTPRGGKSAYVPSGIPFLRSQNVWNYGLDMDDVAYISHETHEKMSNTVVQENDILLNITGASLGRCAIYPEEIGEANVSQHVTIIRPTNPAIRQYLHYCILSPYTQALVWGRQVGMAREGLSKKVLEQFEIPLPPLSEQHRIVSKVDELMALCDRLEQQQSDSIEVHQTLVETLLGTLTRATSHEEFAAAWARIAEHFDTLFTTEHSIDQLKQTILQLAVMGKLVPQDPTDEPSSQLLLRIAEEQSRLFAEGKIKKPKKLPEIQIYEQPFLLPKGWEYVRLNDLGEWGAGATPLRGRGDYYGGDIPWFKSGELVDDYISESEEHVTEQALRDTSLRYNKPGDVLIAMYGATIGKTSILEVAATTNQAVCACTPFPGFDNVFLLTLLKAFKNRFVGMGAGGAQPNISREKIIATVIALPPTNEQHRIVAKVDELMALCDALKARLVDAQTTQIHLADAVVEQAVA